jgi:uncharacterized protein YdiU (UPF0061 family)
MMRGKLGLEPGDDERDDGLFERLFELLAEVETDMTLFFRRLADVPDEADAEARMMVLREAFYAPERIGVAHAGLVNAWLDEWLARAHARAQSFICPAQLPRAAGDRSRAGR